MSKPTGCSKMVEGPSIISKQSHGESAHVDFIIFEVFRPFTILLGDPGGEAWE